ncbi:MAG: hypothetical protein ACLRSY_09760, partial [Acutalibacter sp.]
NCAAVGGFCTAVPAAYCPLIPELRDENEQLRSDLRRLQTERDAAEEDLNAIIGDIEEIRRGYGVDNGDADSAFADLCENYCANKSHRCYVEAEKYRCNNFKWRGPKEE